MDMFRKVQREKRIKKRIVSVTYIAMLCLSLILSIRVSPTIASQVAKILGFQAIVSAIAIDKGIKDIVPKGEDFIEVDFGTKEILMKPNYFNGDISAAPQSVSVKMNKDN